MNRLEIYEKVNQTESLEELSKVILELADENGEIQGRTRKFNATKMAETCIGYKEWMNLGFPNVLTREFGIRQQAMYIIYYEQ